MRPGSLKLTLACVSLSLTFCPFVAPRSTYSAEGIPKLNTFEFSPTLVSHRPKLAQELRDFQGTGDDSNGEREISAGQARHLPPKAHIGGLSSHQRQELEGQRRPAFFPAGVRAAH